MLHKFTLFICLMTVLKDVQCGPLSGPAIHLTVSPGQDDVDIVRSHTVACTLDTRLTSMVKVTALTLYGSRSYGTAGQFDSLATVDLWSPVARPLGGLGDADVDVFGEIGRKDVSRSQLGISWKYQLASSPKQYKCVINGLDSNGHVVTISITSVTSITTPHSIDIGVSDNHGAIDKQQVNSTSTDMESVELNFQNLTSKVDDIGEAVNCLEKLIENQSLTTIQKQQTILNELKLAKLASVLDKFDVSAVFQGRRYFVTKAVASFNIRNADFLCEVMGGYLTEIEDKEEYDFLLNFLSGRVAVIFSLVQMILTKRACGPIGTAGNLSPMPTGDQVSQTTIETKRTAWKYVLASKAAMTGIAPQTLSLSVRFLYKTQCQHVLC